MKRSLFGALAAAVALASCGGGAQVAGDGGKGGLVAHTPADRYVVAVLINAPGGGAGCKVLAAGNSALTQDHVTWKVYNFCTSANGQTIEIRWDNNVAPTSNTNQLRDTVVDSNSNPVRFARLMMNVDNWTTGSVCPNNSRAWCFHYSFWLTPPGGTSVQLPEDPDFEVDP